MLKWSSFDWKYFFMFLVGLAALYPAWVPLLQSPESAIDVRLISQSALQPSATKDKDFGLELTIDGKPVNDPYLSVIQLVNTGNKPISSRDFESPIGIAIGESKKIIRAQVTDVSPKDLKPAIEFDATQIQIQPMLLNSHDTITLAILSTDGTPTFEPSARIAGIESLTLSLLNTEKKDPYFTYVLVFLMVMTIVAANAMAWRSEIAGNKVTTLNRGTAFLSSAILLYLALLMIQILIPRIGLESSWFLVPIYLLISALTYPFVKWLEKRPPVIEQEPNVITS